jgi:hypothetical protein
MRPDKPKFNVGDRVIFYYAGKNVVDTISRIDYHEDWTFFYETKKSCILVSEGHLKRVRRKDQMTKTQIFNKWFDKIWGEENNFYSILKAETLEDAWEKTLAKWGKKGAVRAFYLTSDGCGLCNMFWWNDCKGCPIAKQSGLKFCHGFKAYHDMSHVSSSNLERVEEIRKKGLRQLKAIKKATEKS